MTKNNTRKDKNGKEEHKEERKEVLHKKSKESMTRWN